MRHASEFERMKGFGVEESKRPKQEKVDTSTGGWGISGAFRKLAVD